MAYVITEPCLGTKDKGGVEVCPVDCIYEGVMEQDGKVYDMLFIHPEDCIDGGLCVPECPVEAIFGAEEVPEVWKHFVEINAGFFTSTSGEVVVNGVPALPSEVGGANLNETEVVAEIFRKEQAG